MNQPASRMFDAVYQRTAKGQAAVLQGEALELDAEHRRLLLLVNGFTPMATLVRVAHLRCEAEAVASTLKARGLIEEASGDPSHKSKGVNVWSSHCH